MWHTPHTTRHCTDDVPPAPQISVTVLPMGVTGKPLNSSFRTRENADYLAELGNTITNFARIVRRRRLLRGVCAAAQPRTAVRCVHPCVLAPWYSIACACVCACGHQVPDGLLVFFPSYYVMSKCVGEWMSTGIYRRMERYKTIAVEPRTASEIVAVASAYRDAVDSGKGAIFFAVCRGKVGGGHHGARVTCVASQRMTRPSRGVRAGQRRYRLSGQVRTLCRHHGPAIPAVQGVSLRLCVPSTLPWRQLYAGSS